MNRLTFKADGHTYLLDGKPITGVTTILQTVGKGDGLTQWAANMAVEYIRANKDREAWDELLEKARFAHRKKKEDAGTSGTEIHAIAEGWIKTGNLPLVVPQQIQNFVKWADESRVKFIESEKQVYSEKYWYAGTCDILCEIDGKKYIGDIKTSSGIYETHFYQAAAYQNALQEMGYGQIDGQIIINLKKDGTMRVETMYGFEENFNAFLAALTLYRTGEKLKAIIKPEWKK